ncbi:MAG: hypothetical protein KAT66_10880 [Candidatus Lokiarchaeota archaeon]|nr:hypothetical protein [Candidatus Lokiarchaeota archaeon]
MKKRIIGVGVGLISIILLITPIIPASEYNQIIEYQTDLIDENLQDLKTNINQIFDLLEKTRIDSTISFSQNNSIIENFKNTIDDLRNNIENDNLNLGILPISNLLLSLILALIGTIIGILFGPIIALGIMILVSPALLLAKIIIFILDLFN